VCARVSTRACPDSWPCCCLITVIMPGAHVMLCCACWLKFGVSASWASLACVVSVCRSVHAHITCRCMCMLVAVVACRCESGSCFCSHCPLSSPGVHVRSAHRQLGLSWLSASSAGRLLALRRCTFCGLSPRLSRILNESRDALVAAFDARNCSTWPERPG
jgi:hypothetical protein